MRVIDHRHFKKSKPKRPRWVRPVLIGAACVVGVFVLANVLMGIMYRNKVLPNYTLGAVPVGNVAFDHLNQKVPLDKLLPAEITFTKDDTKQVRSPQELGVTIDWPASRENLKKARSWLPVLSLFGKHSVPVELTFDEQSFKAAADALAPEFSKAALPERIVFNGTAFALAAPEAGYQFDTAQFKTQLITALEQGKATLAVPTTPTASDVPATDLSGELAALQKKLSRKFNYSVGGQNKQPGASDIGKWFTASGQTMVLSEDLVRAYVKGLAASVYNTEDAAAATRYGLTTNQDLTFVLGTTQTPSKYTYCTATRGVSDAELPGFIAKVAATLGDPRGWNAGGKITFNRVASGCDFTVWLSAPSQMTSFGGVCDSYYSCRSGRNVVINFDRWQGATPPWNAAGGTLEDYRVMVTNHEVGHWLGFGHSSCPGAGQPAPVMQQQSISLQGCSFNPWPIAGELAAAS